MHTRQGVAEPAHPENNAACLTAAHPHHIEEMAEPGDLVAIYSLAHVLLQARRPRLPRSRITVGPRWLEWLLTLYVQIDPDVIVLVLVVLLAVVALLVGER